MALSQPTQVPFNCRDPHHIGVLFVDLYQLADSKVVEMDFSCALHVLKYNRWTDILVSTCSIAIRVP